MPSILTIADSPSVSNQNPNAFEKLVQNLSAVLGPSSGLGPDDVNPLIIEKLMESYVSKESEWASFALRDASMAYTRNLIDDGNGKSNLLILVWSPGQGSAIHDHANSHCVMKILKGKLQETLYSWPDENKINKGEVAPLMVTKQTIYDENQVAYISDELGVHRVSNPDPETFAVSLHLYTPPNASIHGVHIFNEKTGRPTHIKMSNFYSVRGKRTSEIEAVDNSTSNSTV